MKFTTAALLLTTSVTQAKYPDTCSEDYLCQDTSYAAQRQCLGKRITAIEGGSTVVVKNNKGEEMTLEVGDVSSWECHSQDWAQ